MSDAAITALCGLGVAFIGVVGLLIRRKKPHPRREDVGYDGLWDRIDAQDVKIEALGRKIDGVTGERDRLRTAYRILSDAYDALAAALSRTMPAPVFTRGEQDAIDRAKVLRDDDSMWPTEQRLSTE
ncbi:hypothetical protein [Curtobacterium sp. MCBD17_030]|uniref:hypothetical protein n=1 Tax=Curtobacterium sp. MCBD17_030 TaxID=2175649 RepID=UPI000D937A33|nr:hypothetical protein [Curtobacterium sp. MCBD17_030]PYY32342.1 hypothetical protein DEI89_12980 [Curtobacterium sp. MCBD17_030]